ncbi:MAG: hypothetical protein R2711_05570 [Acidimicrobiales bacterium]
MGTEDPPGTIVHRGGRRPGPASPRWRWAPRCARCLEQVGGVRRIDEVRAVLPGVSAPMVGPDGLDTPLTYEDMTSLGSGLGSAGSTVGRRSSPLRWPPVRRGSSPVESAVHALQAGRPPDRHLA